MAFALHSEDTNPRLDSMDGFTLSLLTRELNETLTGGRIDKVIQPERDELILTIRNGGANHQLLLSASAGCARAHLTQEKKKSPLEPFNLCMLMRKYLLGGRIREIRQIDCDRILEVEIEHLDELGDAARKIIICEFMGKHSNIIFTGADGRIIDSARRVTELISSVREVLPGLRYERPPAHGKIPFDRVEASELMERIGPARGPVRKILSQAISGMSAPLAAELTFRACGNEEAHLEETDIPALCESVAENLRYLLQNPHPAVLFDENENPADVVGIEYRSRAAWTQRVYPTLSEAFDAFYVTRDLSERISQKSASIHRTLRTNIERLEKKLQLQQEALLNSERMEEYRICGELLTANLHLSTKGKKSISLPNYYDPEMKAIEIPLDEKLSASGNAQRYFKMYRKAANAKSLAAEQVEKTTEELNYLEGQLDNLGKCIEESELSELRDELEKFGYVKKPSSRRSIKSLPPSQPMQFTAPSGRTVLVGKNNLQNDKLTFSAMPDEIWLHAKDMPGSHVIIVGENPDDATILYAARLAAAYSRGSASSKVPVDYTRRRYVKKPSGARPGFVIYTNQHTLFVDPENRKGQPD